MLLSTSVSVLGQAPQNGCCQCLCPQAVLQLPPASLGGSLRPTGGSDQGSFQITASAVDPGACEIWDVVISSELSISQLSGSPESKPC